jgi:hypothetical protein
LGFIDDSGEGTAPWEEADEVHAEGGDGEPESDEELSDFPQTPSKKRKRTLDALVVSRAVKRRKK